MAQINKEVTISQYVGGYLKRELRIRNTTQEQFAEQFGVDPRTVRRWISGGVHSLDVVAEIAEYLGVSVRDIFSDEEDVPFLFILNRNRTNAALFRFSFLLYTFYRNKKSRLITIFRR